MGLSRRAFARTRNISEAAVRKHIAAGTIVVEADGTVDPDRADRALAGTLTRRKQTKVPAVLRTAKQRHQRAIVRDLQDEVGELERSLVAPDDAESVANDMFQQTNSIIRLWPAKIAATVAGEPAEVVQRRLKKGINDLLGELHEFLTRFESAPGNEPKTDPDLDGMSPVELAAHAEHLRARLLELRRWERRRQLVRVEDARDLCNEALMISKSLMLALPGRTDIQVASSDIETATKILAAEVDQICAAAHLDLSSLTVGAKR